jgi:hypothetical protein
MKFIVRRIVLIAAVFVTAGLASFAAGDDAVITYRKIFKGSTPEFVELRIGQSGKCTFDIRQLAEDPSAQPFTVGDALREKIFALAGELKNFRDADLDVHRKIANLGEKTFRYEKGSEVHETKFNYTTNEPANQLYQIFEGFSRQQEHVVTLQRRLKHDRLGLNEELMYLQKDYDEKMIPEPQNLLPVLQEISDDSRVIDVARTHARALMAKIRGAK